MEANGPRDGRSVLWSRRNLPYNGPILSNGSGTRARRDARSMAGRDDRVERAFGLAKERYAEFGVDAETALNRLAAIAVSLHCWQGDDVGGFEGTGEAIEPSAPSGT